MTARPFLVALLIVASAALAACSSDSQEGSGGELEGTDWILRSYAVDGALVSVADGEYADAAFKGHQVSGDSGCNSYNALYRSGGRTLVVQPTVAATMMACPEEAMVFEQAFLAGLTATRLYSVRRSELTTFDGNGDVALIFDAAPRNPLLGHWLVDSFQVSEGQFTAPLEGTELDVAFGILGVGGFSGCNSFSGTYSTNGNIVRVGPLATTRIACDQEVMDQEAAFLSALQGVAFIDTGASSLMLKDASGDVVVALVRPSEPDASGSPSPSAEPSASTEPSASAEPSASETPAPSATPTAEPTPTPAPTPVPSLPAIPTLPPIAVAECTLSGEAEIATIAYPDGWSTLAEPADLACRYFDPEEITVPADPTTLSTAVMIQTPNLAYADAVAAALEPETWDVIAQFELDSDVPITFVEAEALVDVDGTAAGERRAAYLIDLGEATLVMFTTGDPDDVAYPGDKVVLSFMLSRSAFVAPA